MSEGGSSEGGQDPLFNLNTNIYLLMNKVMLVNAYDKQPWCDIMYLGIMVDYKTAPYRPKGFRCE